MSAPVRAKRRLYLDETRTRVLEDGDLDARYLLCVPGGDIPYETAVKYGLLDGEPGEPEDAPEEAEPDSEPVKARPAPSNKARPRTGDK